MFFKENKNLLTFLDICGIITLVRILETDIEYDTITRGERPGAFFLELEEERVARVLKTATDKEFALYHFETKDFFMVVWDSSLETFRISRNGKRLAADSDAYYSVHKLLLKVLVPFAKNRRKKVWDFEKEFQREAIRVLVMERNRGY